MNIQVASKAPHVVVLRNEGEAAAVIGGRQQATILLDFDPSFKTGDRLLLVLPTRGVFTAVVRQNSQPTHAGKLSDEDARACGFRDGTGALLWLTQHHLNVSEMTPVTVVHWRNVKPLLEWSVDSLDRP